MMSELNDQKTGSWHNDFLQIYMESGLVGLLPLLWLIGTTYKQALKAIRSPQLTPLHRLLLSPLLISISVFVLAGGMFDTIMGLIFRLELAIVALIAGSDYSDAKGIGRGQGT